MQTNPKFSLDGYQAPVGWAIPKAFSLSCKVKSVALEEGAADLLTHKSGCSNKKLEEAPLLLRELEIVRKETSF